MDIRVIAIDPGITTGIAIGVFTDDPLNELEIIAFEDQWKKEDQHSALWNQLVEFGPDVIVYESFEFRNKSRDNVELFSRELIGVINLYGQRSHDVKLVKQTPAQAMGHFSNERLKEYGCYTVGSEHARDATRHILHWFFFGHGSQFALVNGEFIGKVRMS